MSENIEISLGAGKSYLLETAGKICDKNIIVRNESYDAFWDAFQQNGERAEYAYGFAGYGWTDETFKPKYDIKPVNSTHLFSGCRITDLVKMLSNCGIVFDFSRNVGTSYIMQGNSYTETLPIIDTRARADINYFLFDCSKLRLIEKIILKNEGTQKFNAYSFGSLPKLESVIFEGSIGSNFDIKGSPLLSADSVQSIINCLKDLTGQMQQTLTLHATVGANLTQAQKDAITTKNWQLVY